jgi:hypothetical protein
MNFEDLEQNVNGLQIITTTKIRKYVWNSEPCDIATSFTYQWGLMHYE